jgi:hypothetical protein
MHLLSHMRRYQVMWQFIVGMVVGWFVYLHYSEQVIAAGNWVIGQVQ